MSSECSLCFSPLLLTSPRLDLFWSSPRSTRPLAVIKLHTKGTRVCHNILRSTLPPLSTLYRFTQLLPSVFPPLSTILSMTSITTFAYGLTVRATGLITAAHAWTSLEPTFDFFDLLFLRKRKGTLQSRLSGPTREAIIGKVPVEVWEEIRKWVLVIEMEDKEDSLIRQFSIPCGDEDCNCQGVTKVTWELLKQGTSYCVSLEWLSHGVSLGEFLDRFSSGYGDAIEVSRCRSSS